MSNGHQDTIKDTRQKGGDLDVILTFCYSEQAFYAVLCIAYAGVEYLNVSFSGLITSVGEEIVHCFCYRVHVYMSLVVRKPVFGVSDLVQHKTGCTTIEDC